MPITHVLYAIINRNNRYITPEKGYTSDISCAELFKTPEAARDCTCTKYEERIVEVHITIGEVVVCNTQET